MSNFYSKGYPSLVFRTYVNKNGIASQRTAILSDQVPEEKYWWIPYLSVFTDDTGTAMKFDVVIVPQEAFNVNVTALVPNNAVAAATPLGCIKIAPVDGAANSGLMNTLTTQSSRAACPLFTMNRIIVPSKCALLVMEATNPPPANARAIGMSMFLAELDNGCNPPIF